MKCKLLDVVNFNPKETIKKGCLAKKVAMDKLRPFCRDILEYEITEFTGGTKFRNGDTIMARITPCLENGKTAKVNILNENEVGFGSTEYIVFRAKKDLLDEDYLYYLVCSPIVRDIAIKSMVGSSGRQRAQLDVIQNIEINLPTIEEQREVGALLKSLDDKIELNNKINENLFQQVMAIYGSMFVDHENEARITCRADEYFDISIGKTPPRKEPQWFCENSNGCVWVSISDMGSCGLYVTDSAEHLTQEAVNKFKVKIVPDNTVLLSFKLTVGRIAITDGTMTTNEAIAHFKTDKPEINEYLYCYLKKFNFQTMGSTSSIATAVNSKIIKAMPFVVPSEVELNAFHSVVAPCFRMIKQNQRENIRLAVLRDNLLPRLISGEIDVNIQI